MRAQCEDRTRPSLGDDARNTTQQSHKSTYYDDVCDKTNLTTLITIIFVLAMTNK